MSTVNNTVRAVGAIISDAVRDNDQCRPEKKVVTCFESRQPAPITIADYTQRLLDYGHMSEEAFVCALVLIDRVAVKWPQLAPTSSNAHRLLVTAVIVAAKLRDDIHYSNAYFAWVGGLRTSELTALEAHLLQWLDFDIQVSKEDYLRYLNEISSRHGPLSEPATTLLQSQWRDSVQKENHIFVQREAIHTPEGTECGEVSDEMMSED
eukprot:Hpha_TRINITY_DN14690_c0_g1::TRINITY_DN14690_c0_g1_i1::g.48181::m.48181